jgi:Spy/CpxP family protein refolding chaperone
MASTGSDSADTLNPSPLTMEILMRCIVPLIAVLVLATSTAVTEGPNGPSPMGGPGGPAGAPFDQFLFPPELILSNQVALRLTDEQITSIKKLLNETQARTLDLQVDLQRVSERLSRAVEPPRVDEATVLAAADQAMSLESQIKKAHLTLMIRLKNLLTQDQQHRLADLRPPRPTGPSPQH